MELYKKYRPKVIEEIIGQPEAVDTINGFLNRENFPHSILLSGPSGVGKTTIARLLRRKLECGKNDFKEINAADDRGIDTLRSVKSAMGYSPIAGRSKIWLFDECFDKNTLVNTTTRSKKICDIKKGDSIYNIAGDSVVERVFLNKVELSRVVKLKFNDGSIIFTTKQHKFLTENGWMEAQNIKNEWIHCFKKNEVGINEYENCHRSRWESTLAQGKYNERQKKDPNTRRIRLESIEVYQRGHNEQSFLGVIGNIEINQGFVEFYDLQIRGDPSYFVDGIPVHNCHQFLSPSQSILLKMLEDTPKHVYFMLATTDPQKLLPTIRTRCSDIKLRSLTEEEIISLINLVCEKENIKISNEVIDKISEVSEGSARKSLVLLDSIIGLETEEEQLNFVTFNDARKVSQNIASLLVNNKSTWKEVADQLKDITDEDSERLRRGVLGYASKVILNNKNESWKARCYMILCAFECNFFDSGKAGLVRACYEVMKEK